MKGNVFDSVLNKNGEELSVGDQVNVGEPQFNDMHQTGFLGEIVTVYLEDARVCVMDQEGNCFDVDADNVEKVD